MPDLSYYSFVQVEDDESSIFYQFITAKNIAYTVYFNINEYSQYVEDYPLLLQKGYAFGFRRQKFNTAERSHADNIIFQTIYHIVMDFMSQVGKEAVLLYHCDTSDNKQYCRNKLFSNWEKLTPKDCSLIKHSIEVQIDRSDGKGAISNFLGFITSINNPLIDEVKNEFDDFSINLIQPKD